MNIHLYNFSKDTKSTKVPSIDGTIVNVNLKNDTSIDSPVFVIDGLINTKFNYLKWDNRFYFINDIVYLNNSIYELHCNIDVMATYRDTILSSNQYVLRADSIGDTPIQNVYATDSNYPIVGDAEHTILLDENNVFNDTFQFYVVGIQGAGVDINDQIHTVGAISYYLMTPYMLNRFNAYITNGQWMEGLIPGISTDILKLILKPTEFIVSCVGYNIEFPTDLSASNGIYACNKITFGWFEINVTDAPNELFLIDQKCVLNNYTTFNIPFHYQTNNRLWYMNYAPFTNIELECYPIGKFNIDMTKLYKSMGEVQGYDLTINMFTSLIDGSTILRIGTTGEIGTAAPHWISSHIGNIGNPVTLTRSNVNVTATAGGSLMGAGTAIAGAVSENAVGVAAGVAAMGASLNNNMMPKPDYISAQGAMVLAKKNKIAVNITRRHTAYKDDTRMGVPVLAPLNIGSINGYCVCKVVAIDIPAPATHIDSVKAQMESGFLVE